MTVAYRARREIGDTAEHDFVHWVRLNPGWDVFPYGQALLNKQARDALRSTPFNGSGEMIEHLIAKLPPTIRTAYIEGIGGSVPTLARWTPDALMGFRGRIICCPDVKNANPNYPNTWSIEISSILASFVQSWYGMPSMYVFPPSAHWNHWTCASSLHVCKVFTRAFSGKTARGSGTPFVSIPKLLVDCSLRRVMTEIELNGAFSFDGVLL
jgi:hypothetical protein